jgi:hypothetical protein
VLSTLSRSICVSALLLLAGTGRAGTITAEFTGTSNNGSPTVSINNGNGSSSLTSYNFAGYVDWTQKPGLNNSSVPLQFTTFCIELTQSISFGKTYTFTTTTLDVAPTPGSPQTGGPSGMGLIKADAISRLWGGFYTNHMSANDAAAFQLAIWKIEYDGIASTISDFSHGNFRASGPSGVINEAMLLYNNVVNNVYSESTAATNLMALTSPTLQDQVVQHAPEPSSLCLGLIGTLVVSVVRCRRRKKTSSGAPATLAVLTVL